MKQINLKSKFARVLLWVIILLGGLVIAFPIFKDSPPTFIGSPTLVSDPTSDDLDYSNAQLSDNGLFNVSYTASTGTIPINQIHQWILHVETANGQPVENATIAVDGDMPEHGHGLPTRPRVTRYLGEGNYLVEGIKFQMGGWWVIDFTITTNDQTDAVHFNMQLK